MENPLKKERIIQGLMRLDNVSEDSLYELIRSDLDSGIHFFDIADIYMVGECEIKLGAVLRKHPELRKEMIIQTKCGLRRIPGSDVNYYDLSYEHIIQACDASLKRMNIDYIDYYLLHRPDVLMDGKEIAKAFKELKTDGKVRHFGVSNFSPEAIEYLRKETGMPLEINQLQLGLGHLDMIREAVNTNISNAEGTPFSLDLFFYLKRNGMSLQCWSPNSYGFDRTSIFTEPKMAETREYMKVLAERYHITLGGVATAFLLQLGANVQVVTGSVNPSHIKESLEAVNVRFAKEEFYTLYISTGNLLP